MRRVSAPAGSGDLVGLVLEPDAQEHADPGAVGAPAVADGAQRVVVDLARQTIGLPDGVSRRRSWLGTVSGSPAPRRRTSSAGPGKAVTLRSGNATAVPSRSVIRALTAAAWAMRIRWPITAQQAAS